MRVNPAVSKPRMLAVVKAAETDICVGGVITFSPYTATVVIRDYRIICAQPIKPKTLEDFRSSNGIVDLNLDNYNEILDLSSLDALHKGFIRSYFTQVENGILPSTKSLAGWIKSKNKKIKADDELLVIKFLLDIQESGFSLLNMFDDPLVSKIFMAYSKISNHKEVNLNNVSMSLGMQSERSKLKFASEIFNKLKIDDKLIEPVSSLGKDFTGFINLLSKLKEDSFDYLIEKEQLSLLVNSPPAQIENPDEVINLPQPSNVEVEQIESLPKNVRDRIIGFKCELLDELEVDYGNGIPSQHSIATIYTAVGNSSKRARLHEAFHNFNMKHILPVEITYSNNRSLKLFLPVAVCKEILHDLNESGQSSYNLSQWIKQP